MARIVSSFVVSQVTAAINRSLTDTCLVEARVVGAGVYGEPLPGWTTVYLAMPCRVVRVGKRLKSSAGNVGEAISIRDSYRIIYPNTMSITNGMRITTRDGLHYDVASIQENDTDSVMSEAFITRQIGDQP